MKVYSAESVERLILNYWSIRSLIDGGPPQPKPAPYTAPLQFREDRPLGYAKGERWPYMNEIPHAKAPRDGKAKGRAREELHVAAIDLETALDARDECGDYLLSDDDYELIYKYLLVGTHTLEELAKERRLESRGSMHSRMKRALTRLASVMESRKHVRTTNVQGA